MEAAALAVLVVLLFIVGRAARRADSNAQALAAVQVSVEALRGAGVASGLVEAVAAVHRASESLAASAAALDVSASMCAQVDALQARVDELERVAAGLQAEVARLQGQK